MRYYQRALSLGAGRQNSDERKASNLQVGKRKAHLRIPFPVFGTTDDLPVIQQWRTFSVPESCRGLALIVGSNAN
jgi:hypothetical protein